MPTRQQANITMSTTTNWYVSADGSVWVLCSTAGICNPVLTLRTNGVDELAWTMPGDFLADPAYAYASTIYLARGVTTAGVTTYTCKFVGRIISIPRQGASASEMLTFKAAGAWWWLDQVTYSQQWQTMRNTDNALINLNIPRVVLGQNNAGVKVDAGAQIAAVIDWAVAQGAPIVKGTVDTLATLPYSEHTNLRCADAIRQCLRLQPDTCCWFDYDNRNGSNIPVPKFYCRVPANLTAANIATLATDIDTITMTPRYDLQLPGVRIVYEMTCEYSGKSYRYAFIDDAGTVSDPRAVPLLFELQGSTAQTVEQTIVTTAYPVSPYTDKTFWRNLEPFLASIADGDLVIQNVVRSGVASPLLGYYLNEGQITPWMLDALGIHSEVETWEADISYIRKTSGTVEEQVVNKHVKVNILSTDATSGTYSTLQSFSSAEPVPSGVATALYASWNRLHWDGSFRLVEAEASFQAVPGNIVNLTGGRTEWSTMAALVQDVTVDLTSGASTVKTGTCGRLEAESLVALWRAAHFRRFSWNRLTRTDATLDSTGNKVAGGAKLARQVADTSDPGQAKVKRYTGTDSGSRTQIAVIDPSSITFANASDAAAKTLALREVRVLEKQGGGGYKAKLVQALCTPVYDATGGDAIAGAITPTGPNLVLGSDGSSALYWYATVLLTTP